MGDDEHVTVTVVRFSLPVVLVTVNGIVWPGPPGVIAASAEGWLAIVTLTLLPVVAVPVPVPPPDQYA